MKPLDNLCHPVSVIREAEELAADAFGAAHAFLMVGGTTSSVQSMVLTACKRGDEIILPRNVHRSVLNALVLCGAVPVYVNPEVDNRLGISLGMKREQVAKAIAEHPNAVAVLVNNPTYYGICSDLRAIVRMAHDAGMLCLADEAHGTHFYFGGGLPVSAMAAGADMASVSMHKSGGSLTQSSLLLTGPNVHAGYVRQIINLTQTTSGSYLLMSSLDISRRNLALRGRHHGQPAGQPVLRRGRHRHAAQPPAHCQHLSHQQGVSGAHPDLCGGVLAVRLCQQKISSHQRYGRRCVERAEHAHPLLHLPAARRGVLSARFP